MDLPFLVNSILKYIVRIEKVSFYSRHYFSAKEEANVTMNNAEIHNNKMK